ncbi:MAG: cryptochrome/photolyase family protein [Burkholderiaceae bacterium]
MTSAPIRRLLIILGDQLDEHATLLRDVDPDHDLIWMAEVREESTHVRSARARIAVFLAAMRRFADRQRALGRAVEYIRLDDRANTGTLAGELRRAIEAHRPRHLAMTAPGDWRVLDALRRTAREAGLALELEDDTHFLCTVREFATHARGRKQLRLEYFYRELRQRTGILMDKGKPAGGRWNFDAENRRAFGAQGPGELPPPQRFLPDADTRDVLAMVTREFADHPGSLAAFDWPLSRAEAMRALEDFITHRLPGFGRYQDAIWAGEPWLYHSRLASALNLKLLNPRELVQAAERAWRDGHAPIEAVEGFVRQVIGWREYVRGIYWTRMPGYLDSNALEAGEPLPAFYWSGDTPMACLADAIGQTLRVGYAHHIQRLMITGLYALLLGVEPRQVHAWYLAVYVDAVEWVELPNTIGMSQFADGGLMASKPYAASGAYIDRMSNHCRGCRFRPRDKTGEHACPFTVLYWGFLLRHHERLIRNPRMKMPLRHLEGLDDAARRDLQARADAHRSRVRGGAGA